MLQYETIAPETLKLLQRIQAMPEFADTRLVGGTSLALQLGHRISVDLGLFGEWPSSSDLFAALKTQDMLNVETKIVVLICLTMTVRQKLIYSDRFLICRMIFARILMQNFRM